MGGEILGWVHSLRRYDLLRNVSASVFLTLYRAVCTFCPHTEGRTKYTKYTAIRRNDAHSERQAEILAFSQINVSFLRELLCKNMRREKQKRGFFCTAGRAEKCPLGFFLWRSPHQKVDKLVNGGHGACSVLLSHRTASVYVLAPTYCVMLPRELSLP